ncbi:MAG: molybdopterin-synthase adenylyltransferase MoeB [Opitutales bacterium]|nr:molybdopterin-synthase adenylyltransferase MoeB [Opitutales bacterium]
MTQINTQRYDRHLRLASFGPEKQAKLAQSSVLLVGIGGLGSPVALYLAAAGVGRLVLVDDDVVDISNLQRQVLFKDADAGQLKVEVAKRELKAFNPDIQIDAHATRFNPDNALDLLQGIDLVIDGADNFPTRYLVNDAAHFAGIPVVHGSIHQFDGQVSVFQPNDGPCYRCLFPEPPPLGSAPSCAEAGVLGVLPGTVGTIQATEAIKVLTGMGESLTGKLLCWDALSSEQRLLRISKNPNCPLCGAQPSITALAWTGDFCDLDTMNQLSAADYATWRSKNKSHVLLDVREPEEIAQDAIDGHINIPLGQLPMRVNELATLKDTTIVCQCAAGVRSQTAIGILQQEGFSDLHNLDGGIMAWRSEGY